VELRVLARRQFDRRPADRGPLCFTDDYQGGDQQQQAEQSAAHGRGPAGVLQSIGEHGQCHGGLHDEADDDQVEHDHEDEVRQFGGVPQSADGTGLRP
jgi:hypothetical protein